MNKSLPILLLMISNFFMHGQHITFQKNINYKASNLHQSLNTNRDSLLLESKTEQILQVDIFNKDFSESINVHNTKTKIDLNKLPAGNFIIQARLHKKIIVMYLEKNKATTIASSELKEKNIDHKGFAAKFKSNNLTEKNDASYYWVVSESNSNFGSCKSMRLENKGDIVKLITKIKLELKTDVGKNNRLFVYEIYNRSKFMTNQLRNPGYYKTENSEFFNVVPIYNSLNTKE
ncbi:hypothetical protein [Psychroserpens sp.]|uniref:hypothetical protein n=1 Tax=Psychroserpens sp. TaxID=2020870 RepID=UPI002B27208F|nr:hypothetical protein [Psychroserpens sp.]